MDLQTIARLGQSNKALAEVMQHCVMDAPKEIHKLREVNRKLSHIVCHLASGFMEMYDAFQEDGDAFQEDGEEPPSWFHYVSRDALLEIDTMFDLRALQKTIVRTMTDDERQRCIDGGKFTISPEDMAKVAKHLLQRI